MFKKIKRFPGYLWEKIFQRKELNRLAVSEHLLKKEVEEKAEHIEKGEDILKLLYSGDAIRLTHNEKGMILDAIEYVPFRETIELPETKAHVRITWRNLREKIKLHLKENPVVDEIREAPETEPEVKEDDETKEV